MDQLPEGWPRTSRARKRVLGAVMFAGADGTLPIFRSVASPSFRQRFGELPGLLPGAGGLSLEGQEALSGEIVRRRTSPSPALADGLIPERGGRRRDSTAEA